MRIVLWALFLAALWTAALSLIARSPGLHSAPGLWAGAFGLPGVAIANWAQSLVRRRFDRPLEFAIMFLVNWVFYCSVLQGLVSMKRTLWN
ncbi:MAG TPA: hypothetical protein VNI36_06125 [Candidatus Dormibacteraeota bacterium]|nr:hypothetical protein [Candidatus Dormibacteraeota bacterium]